eukprot:8076484-Pyramimonas_sp.AAC.1
MSCALHGNENKPHTLQSFLTAIEATRAFAATSNLALEKWPAVGLTHNKDSLATRLSSCGLLLHAGIVVMVNAGLAILLETAAGDQVALATGLEGAAPLQD